MEKCSYAIHLIFEALTLFAFQAAAISYVVGSLVWMEDPDEAWIDGEVVKVDGEEIKVLCTSGKTVSALNDITHGHFFYTYFLY
jgi:RecJ-like exonuclease